jgi:hypothetical protein
MGTVCKLNLKVKHVGLRMMRPVSRVMKRAEVLRKGWN